MGLWAAAQVLREKGQTCQGRKMRVRDRGMGEHTSDREGEETERQEDSENAHGCGEKGERGGGENGDRVQVCINRSGRQAIATFCLGCNCGD